MYNIDYIQKSQDKDIIQNSNLSLYSNEYISLKEEKKALSDESNLLSFIKREFSKEMQSKINILDIEEDDSDFSHRYEIPYFKPILASNIFNNNNNYKLSSNLFFNLNVLNVSKDNNPINGNNHKKIFNIVKIKKTKFNYLQRKKGFGEKIKKCLDWDNIKVPKEKHFHLDRKKHRIVFQRQHLKVIYSIVDLSYPFNFNKCFDLIKKHIGDKTVKNYKDGKSFHLIKINNEEKIVTLKDKKMLLKANKNAKKIKK